MRIRALSLAAALFAFAGCDEPVPVHGTSDGNQAVLDENGNGDGGALTCAGARASFRACRAAAPSCDGLAHGLRTCLMNHEPGWSDEEPPCRDPEPGGNDLGGPHRGCDDDGPPPRGGDDDGREDRRRRRGSDDGDRPGRGDPGTGDGGGCEPGDDDAPDRCPPSPLPPMEFPDDCQAIADDLETCMNHCGDERDAMEQVCADECDEARFDAEACLQSTPACASPDQGLRACLGAAWQICAADAASGATQPSQACLQAVASCLTQRNTCEATCGDLVRTARAVCGAGGHGHHHGHGHLCEGSGGGDDPYVDGWVVECEDEGSGGGSGGSSGEGAGGSWGDSDDDSGVR